MVHLQQKGTRENERGTVGEKDVTCTLVTGNASNAASIGEEKRAIQLSG